MTKLSKKHKQTKFKRCNCAKNKKRIKTVVNFANSLKLFPKTTIIQNGCKVTLQNVSNLELGWHDGINPMLLGQFYKYEQLILDFNTNDKNKMLKLLRILKRKYTYQLRFYLKYLSKVCKLEKQEQISICFLKKQKIVSFLKFTKLVKKYYQSSCSAKELYQDYLKVANSSIFIDNSFQRTLQCGYNRALFLNQILKGKV